MREIIQPRTTERRMIMTIEEAIAQLKDLRKDRESFAKNVEPDGVFAQVIKAIDIAIKALEENDTLKTEIMAVKSGSDVLKIRKLEEENKELKRLLRLAVEDFQRFRCLMSSGINEEFCETALEYHCNPYDLCNSCPLSGSEKCRWKHTGEAMKILEDNND